MGTLKHDVNSYLETVFKRAHLYGSDLREALIEVAHLLVKSNSQSQAVCTLRKYILCLVQISKILYSRMPIVQQSNAYSFITVLLLHMSYT